MNLVYDFYNSPVGNVYILQNEIGVRQVIITSEQWNKYILSAEPIKKDSVKCSKAIKELDEYFRGDRQEFTVTLSLEGTEFYKNVWEALKKIPYGEIKSYSQIAYDIGSPKSCRAVGQANRKNPIPIFIPCHRVIGKNGNLTGYMGNRVEIKEYLLNMEKKFKDR